MNKSNKRYLSNNHKPFFEYDNLNNVIGYKHHVCVDTVYVKAYLVQEAIEDILASFEFSTERVTEGVWRYTIDLVQVFGVYIILEPHNRLNATMQLHSKFTTNSSGINSRVILDILNRYEWFLRRLDIAFDYVTPYASSATFKRHGNQRQRNYETGKNIGSTQNLHAKANVCHYDRLKKNSALKSDFFNRFEVRIYFEIKERVAFKTLDHTEIARRLQKELFIPHLFFSNLSKAEKQLIKKAAKERNENYLKESLNKKQYEALRKKFKQSRVRLEDSYLDVCDSIYGFLL